MVPHTRPHSFIPAATALTGASIDGLIRPNLRLAFPLPSDGDPNEAKFRHLLDALAKYRPDPAPQSV